GEPVVERDGAARGAVRVQRERQATGALYRDLQRELRQVDQPQRILDVPPAAVVSVVVVAADVEDRRPERRARIEERVEDVGGAVTWVAGVARARMRRAAVRHRAEVVDQLVGGGERGASAVADVEAAV